MPAEPVACYDGPVRLLTWRDDARDSMTVDLLLAVPGPDGGHPFRAMATGREFGQRLALRCVGAAGGTCGEVYAGEAVVMRWSENDRTGMMVRLLLDDGPDGADGVHPFKGLQVGRRAGEPLETTAYAIADDETVAPPSSLRRRTPFDDLGDVRQTHVLCRDPRFRDFLRRNAERLVPDEASRASVLSMDDGPDGFPAAVLRVALGVASRAEMNRQGPVAARAKARWARLKALFADDLHGSRRA